MNVDEQPELALQFQVMSIPTLLVMKDGEAGSQFCKGASDPKQFIVKTTEEA